jgi:anti-sigma factor RsiW
VVADHLRLLVSAHPNDLESGQNHEVKPWFEGRLDFAPVVPADRGELRLLGGAVGYVLDRKAAVMSYALRRHRVTLLAFSGAGLAWPAPNRSAGGVPAYAASRNGFGVVMWRVGDLAYALVSDVSAPELERLATQLAPETRS